MAFSVGKNSYTSKTITCHKYDSWCCMEITVGERNANGIPVKFVSHFKMNPSGTSYFGYAVGYEVGYSKPTSVPSAYGSYDVLSSATPAEYRKNSQGRVVSGYALGDPAGLMKRYGGGYNPGGYYGDNGTYWRPKYGWLPEDSGPRAGTSVLFNGTIPMNPDQSSVKLYYRTRRPYLVTDQVSYEDSIPYGDEWNSDAWFNVGVQEFIINCGMWKIVPDAPFGVASSPSSIDLAQANEMSIGLTFSLGKNAQKTAIYLRTDMTGFSSLACEQEGLLLKEVSDELFEESFSVYSLLGTDSHDGLHHIAKHPDNVNKHIWFELESISKTGHKSARVSTQQTTYIETPSKPPAYFSLSPENAFFAGDTVTVSYPQSTQGTFEIRNLYLVLPNIGEVDVLYLSGGGSVRVKTPNLGFSGWQHSTGKLPINTYLKAVDESGREVYTSENTPYCYLYGVGASAYKKESSGWVLGLAYVEKGGSWEPIRRIYVKGQNGWL